MGCKINAACYMEYLPLQPLPKNHSGILIDVAWPVPLLKMITGTGPKFYNKRVCPVTVISMLNNILCHERDSLSLPPSIPRPPVTSVLTSATSDWVRSKGLDEQILGSTEPFLSLEN